MTEMLAYEVRDNSLAGAGILPGHVVMVALGEETKPGDLAWVYNPQVGDVLRYVAERDGRQVFVPASPGFPVLEEGAAIGKAVRVIKPMPVLG